MGFSQVDDASIVENNGNYYVFATPHQTAIQPIRSEQETLNLLIKRRPAPPLMLGSSRKLFNLVREKCLHLKEIESQIKMYQGPPKQIPELSGTLHELDENEQSVIQMKEKST